MKRTLANLSVLSTLIALAGSAPSCAQKHTRTGDFTAPNHSDESNPEYPEALATTTDPVEIELDGAVAQDREQDVLARLIETVTDETLEVGQRVDAARVLLDLGPSGAASALLTEPATRVLVLQAVDGMASRACAVLEASRDAALSNEELTHLITIAAGARDQRAAECMINAIASSGPVADHAMRSLHRMTGLPPSNDRDRWHAWWTNASQLSTEQWNQTLIAQYADRIERLDSRLSVLDRMVVDLNRRLYFVGDQTARVQLLAEMLASEQRSVQSLAFELADRELSENVTLGPAVEDAAIALLAHTEPEVRAAAARLINRLAPARSAAPMIAALMAETSPIAAEALLLGVARWPDGSQIPVVLRWLREPRTVAPAAQAGVALFDAGLIVGDDHRQAIREALMPLPTEPSAARLLLLSLVGSDAERSLIADLLDTTSERVRQAAIDALARTPESAALLIERLDRNPAYLPAALIALARHNQLVLVGDRFDAIEAWTQAFGMATSATIKGVLAQQILRRFEVLLSEEDAALYRASAEPGG